MRRKAVLAIAMAFLVAVSMSAPAIAGVASNTLNYGADAPNPVKKVDTVTVDAYEVGWGDSLKYEDNNGDVQDFEATLNSSQDNDDLGTGTVNPFTYTVTDVNFSDADDFPRKGEDDNSASALDPGEYTTGANATMSDVTTAPGVDAVEYAATDNANGDATYSNFSITSDAEKRYFQAFYDIDSASATLVTATIHDATDGDTAVVELYNSSANTDTANVGANSTGEGKAIQVQVGDLSASGGDGTMQEIGKVVIDGDGAANVDFSAINLEKTGKYKLGTKYVDNDDDDDLETEDIYQATGPISVHSVTTLGSTFDNAVINGLSFPAHFQASDIDTEAAIQIDSGDASSYPSFDVVLDIYYKITLPDAYDVSYSGVDLEQTTQWPGERYATVEYNENAGDTDFDDMQDSDWTSKTSSFDAQDKDITIDSTISVGNQDALHYSMKLTQGEADAMQNTGSASTSGGGGGLFGGSGGGFWSMLTSIPGMIITGIGAFFGGRRLGWF